MPSTRQMKLRKAILLFLLVTLPLFSLINPVSSSNTGITELDLSPIEDAYVDDNEPDSNFWDSSYLYAKFSDYDYIPDRRRNSYLKFNLSAVSTEVNIVYAKLELYCWYVGSLTPDVGVHYCADDSWDETEITWNNAPSFSSTPTYVASVLDDYQWYAWDITNDVKTALNDGILTVVLSVQNTGDSFTSNFYSKEGWRNHPKLVIGYATQTFCSVSPSVVTLGGSVTVTGGIPLPQYDTVQLTYTRPDMSTIVRTVATDSDGNFMDTYTPDIEGMWSATAAWDGAEGYNASSSTDLFVVTANERDSWAIIVGVGDYEDNEILDLDYTDDDAIDLCNKLREVWPEDHVKLLVDEDATKSNIESAIKDWLAPKETAESVVLFFFSGHGSRGPDVAPYDETDGKDEYICPYDSLTSSYANDIRDDTLDTWLDSLDSQNINVILHACYSGGFINKVTGKELSPSNLGDNFAKDLSKEGRVIITSCTETEKSYESTTLQHGVFTYYLLEGLNNLELLDDNGDNKISTEEIFDYLAPLVTIYVESYTDWEQHPQMYDNYGGELTLITTITINFDTNPSETSITIDEVIYTPPVSFVWPLYTEHTFNVSKQVESEYEGTRYFFTSWSDGNNLSSRTMIISEFVLTSYTANYQTQYYLSVDSDYGSPAGEGWYDSGSTSSFEVASTVAVSEGTRVAFTRWSGDSSSTSSSSTLVMDAPKQVSAEWQTQYYLSVDVDPLGIVSLSGEGWYDEGSAALTENAPSTCSGGEGTRYIFETWKVDDVAEGSNPISVLMDSPHSVVASYRTQYYLTVVSQHVPTEGEGWYDKDSEASFSVKSPQGLVIQNVFTRWSGDSISTSQSATILMNGPKTLTANWREEYTQLFIILIVAALAIISIVAVRKLRAR
ncbi:MAG: DNRLRE domain-containing protein [Candidatus Bathyarchaeota archaeon]